ncbi:MAG: protease modulator HflC [Betaproteobacteria bacterium]|nr:protease modulator HflC [Betaproteobacteria bacterium]NBT74578.1 protease modulator HflC [Betaproteobacteria bacterium]NBY13955.1 protease modulator HflC [Betaproteobacteria bacterium]
MNRVLPAIVGALLAVLVVSSCVFVVDQRQYGLVFALGEIKRVVAEPGLYLKMPPPFQNVVFIEKRILTLDTPDADRFITSEKKNVVVDTYVKWRVHDPKVFYTSVAGRMSSAEDRISRALRDGLNNEIATRTVAQVVSGAREKVMEGILARVSEDAKQIGVEIVDVRLRRVDFADEIRDSVFRRMESERKAIASERRSQGSAEAEKIRANADRQREGTLARAYQKAQIIKGDGDAKASASYASAFGQNPEFAAFYRSLQAYRQSFSKSSDVIVADPQSDFFRYFRGQAGKK